MKQTTPKLDEVWYVDSDTSNHMTSHKEWFSYLRKPMQPQVVVVGDKAVNAEARATLCVMKNLCIGESNIRTQRERER